MARIQQVFDRKVRALRAAWKKAGVDGVAMLALRSRLVPRKLLFVHDLDVLKLVEPNVHALVALTGAYEFAVADASILEELVECADTPASIELRREALARVLALGASCTTVRHRGRVVAYVCAFAGKFVLTYDDYGPKTLSFALDGNAIFLGNSFIRPEYRMKASSRTSCATARSATRRTPSSSGTSMPTTFTRSTPIAVLDLSRSSPSPASASAPRVSSFSARSARGGARTSTIVRASALSSKKGGLALAAEG